MSYMTGCMKVHTCSSETTHLLFAAQKSLELSSRLAQATSSNEAVTAKTNTSNDEAPMSESTSLNHWQVKLS